MVTEDLNMSLSSKREYLAKLHGRYQRAGRPHKSGLLDEFCLNCGDYVNSLTFTDLFSGWTENRALWNKSG